MCIILFRKSMPSLWPRDVFPCCVLDLISIHPSDGASKRAARHDFGFVFKEKNSVDCHECWENENNAQEPFSGQSIFIYIDHRSGALIIKFG